MSVSFQLPTRMLIFFCLFDKCQQAARQQNRGLQFTQLEVRKYNMEGVPPFTNTLAGVFSKTDRHLLRQKVGQEISVIITNTCVFVVFKTKCESECQNELSFLISSKVFGLMTEIF